MLRPDQLAPANGFSAHNAHDALGDVDTIYLAGATKPNLWQAKLNNRFRQQSLEHLTTFKPMEMIVDMVGKPPINYRLLLRPSERRNSMVGFFDLEAATQQNSLSKMFQEAQPQPENHSFVNSTPSRIC